MVAQLSAQLEGRQGRSANYSLVSMSSPLEDLLLSQVGQARLDSSGSFTLAREKALEKMAAFQLPGPHSWVLKMVQAAVASGCSALQVSQTQRETQLRFRGNPGWNVAEVEEAFFNPEAESRPGLGHLKQGLWSVGLQSTRAFYLTGDNWDEALFWNGVSLSRQPAVRSQGSVLAVSHRTYEERTAWLVARELEAARYNAEFMLELCGRAFTCPIPLTLDGRRFDALQSCPHHGLSPRSYPLQIGFIEGSLPELAVPKATLGGFHRDPLLAHDMEKLVAHCKSIPSRCALMGMVTAHVERVNERQCQGWRSYRHASWIYWVRDGVVVDVRGFILPEGCVSFGLVASAQDLSLDVSGFSLLVDDRYRQRVKEICRLAQPFLQEASVRAEPVREEAAKGSRRTGVALLAGGLGLFLLEPVSGSCLSLAGLFQAVTGRTEGLDVLGDLERDLGKLQASWETL